MKIVEIPKPIECSVIWTVQLNTGNAITSSTKKMTFADWLSSSLDLYGPQGKGSKAAHIAMKIHQKIMSIDGQATVEFEDDHFRILKEGVEAMDWGTAINRQITPFYEAMERAQDVPTALKI